MTPDELRKIPKVELHRHLEGSLRLSTLRELATSAGLSVPADDNELKKQWLVTKPMRDLEAVLHRFLASQKVLSTEEILTRITYEAVEDAFHDGTRILELRYAPTFVQLGHENLSFEAIHLAIRKGLQLAAKFPVAVGLIAIIQRVLPLRDAARVTDFAIENKDSFVGLDLADNEVGFEPEPFAPLFLKAKKAGLHLTVHSGESDVPGSEDFVRTAIELLGAERIGHGVQIHRSGAMIDFVKRKHVPLELCPTSNWLTNAVPSVDRHPFRKLMDAGVLVTINTDDPGMFAIDLAHEYEILHTHFALTREEFDRCNNMAAAFSFLPLETKQKYWPRPILQDLAPWN